MQLNGSQYMKASQTVHGLRNPVSLFIARKKMVEIFTKMQGCKLLLVKTWILLVNILYSTVKYSQDLTF